MVKWFQPGRIYYHRRWRWLTVSVGAVFGLGVEVNYLLGRWELFAVIGPVSVSVNRPKLSTAVQKAVGKPGLSFPDRPLVPTQDAVFDWPPNLPPADPG